MGPRNRVRRLFAVLIGASAVALTAGIVTHADESGDEHKRGTPVPHLVGPIPVTATSHPFGTTSIEANIINSTSPAKPTRSRVTYPGSAGMPTPRHPRADGISNVR